MELQQATKDKEVGYHKTSIGLKNKLSKNKLTFIVEQIYNAVTKKVFAVLFHLNLHGPKMHEWLVVTLPIRRRRTKRKHAV